MDIIKEALKKAGYTQKDFAENVLGVKRLALFYAIYQVITMM